MYVERDTVVVHLKNKQNGDWCQVAGILLGILLAGFVVRVTDTTATSPQRVDAVRSKIFTDI